MSVRSALLRPRPLLAALLATSAAGCSVLKPATDEPAPARAEAPAASSTDTRAESRAEPRAEPKAEPSRAARTDEKPAAGATPGLTDANIAAIVVAANNADIAYADQALAKSRDPEIRQFATMTKKDHETINQVAGALVTRLKVVPADNETSFDIRDDADAKRQVLRELEDFAFDSAYAHNEVEYHRTVLAAIDGALIPSARNAELKALLVQVRPAVAAHLGHAEALAQKKRVRRR